MGQPQKTVKLVGQFIRERREALGLSQRALGLKFDPPVTTQFISNVERGVTPLPPAHIPILVKSLLIAEEELLSLLEKEYTVKLTGRVGRPELGSEILLQSSNGTQIAVNPEDYLFMKRLYEAYRNADEPSRKAFATVCESLLKVAAPDAISE